MLHAGTVLHSPGPCFSVSFPSPPGGNGSLRRHSGNCAFRPPRRFGGRLAPPALAPPSRRSMRRRPPPPPPRPRRSPPTRSATRTPSAAPPPPPGPGGGGRSPPPAPARLMAQGNPATRLPLPSGWSRASNRVESQWATPPLSHVLSRGRGAHVLRMFEIKVLTAVHCSSPGYFDFQPIHPPGNGPPWETVLSPLYLLTCPHQNLSLDLVPADLSP